MLPPPAPPPALAGLLIAGPGLTAALWQPGWTAYFAVAHTPSPFERLDQWLRRRLRQVRWKEWKHVRSKLRKLRAAGIPEREAREWAYSRKGYWRISNSPVLARGRPNEHWTSHGLQGFADPTNVSGMPS